MSLGVDYNIWLNTRLSLQVVILVTTCYSGFIVSSFLLTCFRLSTTILELFPLFEEQHDVVASMLGL